MNLFHFSSSIFRSLSPFGKPARLVWNKVEGQPRPAPAAEAAATAPATPADTAATQAAQAAAGAELKEASKKDDPEKGEKAEQILAQLIGEGTAEVLPVGSESAGDAAPAPEKVQEVIEKHKDILKELFRDVFEFMKLKDDAATAQKAQELAKKLADAAPTIETSMKNPEDMKVLRWILTAEATDAELKDFTDKYVIDGAVTGVPADLKIPADGAITLGQMRFALVYHSFLTKNPTTTPDLTITAAADIDASGLQTAMNRADQLEKALKLERSGGLCKTYETLLGQFESGAIDAPKLLGKIPEKDRAQVQRLIESKPDENEQNALAKKLNKSDSKTKPEAALLYASISDPALNYRERMTALTMLTDEDISALRQSGKITTDEEADKLRAMRQAFENAAGGEESPLEDAAKAGGFMAILERLIEKLSALFEKLAGKIDKMFDSKEKKGAKFSKPPLELAAGAKLTIKEKYKKDQGVIFEAPAGTKVLAVGAGKISKVDMDAKIVEIIGSGGRKALYTNVTPNSNMIVGGEVKAGDALGTVFGDAGLGFRLLDQQDNETDPTAMFSNFTSDTATSAEAAPASAAAATTTAAGTETAPTGTAGTTAEGTGIAASGGAKIENPKPAEITFDQQYQEALAAALEPYYGKTTEIEDGEILHFNLPFMDGNKLSSAPCIITSDELQIDNRVYKIELLAGAKIQSVKINGTYETDGKATLEAGMLVFSDKQDIPLKDLLVHLENLRTGRGQYIVNLGGKQIKFIPQ